MVVLGGTFDPVHLGHMHGAHHVSRALDNSVVTLMVAPNPQLRNPPQASLRDRWTMLRLACESDPALRASRFEDGYNGPTRTIQTLRDLTKTNKIPIVWAIGMDAFENVGSWYKAAELSQVVSFFVLSRSDSRKSALLSGFSQVEKPIQLFSNPGGVFLSTAPMLDVSATEIRRKVRNGCDASSLLHPSVYEHIIKKRLYIG